MNDLNPHELLMEQRAMLLGLADEFREKYAKLKKVPPIYSGAMAVLTPLLKWHQDVKNKNSEILPMERVKAEIKTKFVTLEDIPSRARGGEKEQYLINETEELLAAVKEAKRKGLPENKLPAALIEGVRPSSFATQISKLKKARKIHDSITVVQRKGNVYLTVK